MRKFCRLIVVESVSASYGLDFRIRASTIVLRTRWISAYVEADDDHCFRTINIFVPDLRYIIGVCAETKIESFIQNAGRWGLLSCRSLLLFSLYKLHLLNG